MLDAGGYKNVENRHCTRSHKQLPMRQTRQDKHARDGKLSKAL